MLSIIVMDLPYPKDIQLTTPNRTVSSECSPDAGETAHRSPPGSVHRLRFSERWERGTLWAPQIRLKHRSIKRIDLSSSLRSDLLSYTPTLPHDLGSKRRRKRVKQKRTQDSSDGWSTLWGLSSLPSDFNKSSSLIRPIARLPARLRFAVAKRGRFQAKGVRPMTLKISQIV